MAHAHNSENEMLEWTDLDGGPKEPNDANVNMYIDNDSDDDREDSSTPQQKAVGHKMLCCCCTAEASNFWHSSKGEW